MSSALARAAFDTPFSPPRRHSSCHQSLSSPSRQSRSSIGEYHDLTVTRSGGCCGVQRRLRSFFVQHGWGALWYRCRVALGLVGMVLIWFSAWNLEVYDCAFPAGWDCALPNALLNHTTVQAQLQLWSNLGGSKHRSFDLGGDNPMAHRGEIVMVVGFVLSVLSDTLYTGAGLEGGMFPSFHTDQIKKMALGKALTSLRTLMGLAGLTAMWSGMYQVCLNTDMGNTWTKCDGPAGVGTCPSDTWYHVVVFCAGILLLLVTGTYSGATFLCPPEAADRHNPLQLFFRFHDVEDPSRMTLFDHLRYVIRVLISVFGQTLLWLSTQRGFDATIPTNADGTDADTYWRPLTFLFVGLSMLSMTDSVVANSWISESEVAYDTCYEGDSREADDDDALMDIELGPADAMSPLPSPFERKPDAYKGAQEINDPYSIQERGVSDKEGSAAPARHPMTKFYTTSFISLMGQLTFVYGLWNWLDVFLIGTVKGGALGPGTWLAYKTTELNLICLLVGLVMVSLAGTLMTNAGIDLVPVFYTDGTQGEHRHALHRHVAHALAEVAVRGRSMTFGPAEMRKLEKVIGVLERFEGRDRFEGRVRSSSTASARSFTQPLIQHSSHGRERDWTGRDTR